MCSMFLQVKVCQSLNHMNLYKSMINSLCFQSDEPNLEFVQSSFDRQSVAF